MSAKNSGTSRAACPNLQPRVNRARDCVVTPQCFLGVPPCLANLHKQFSDNSILSLSFVTGEVEGWGSVLLLICS